MATINLPNPRIVFPVKIPYYVRSDMYKLGNSLDGIAETDLFVVDSDYEKTTVAVLDMLRNYPDHVRVYLDDDIESLTACLWEVARCIADDQPQYFSYQDGQFTSRLLGITLKRDQGIQLDPQVAVFKDLAFACHAHLKPLAPFEQLCDFLRLSVQEDLVIGKVNLEEAQDVMECLLVPIPSKWTPLEKIGLSFAATHAPIPNSERLQAAAPRLINAIMSKRRVHPL